MSPTAIETVPTGKNNWWKEATIYQVRRNPLTTENANPNRSTRHLSKTLTAMDGVIFLG
jgi:hypothetical protein